MRCCDCGLIHVLDFRLIDNYYGRGKKIQFRASRDDRATALTKERRKLPKRKK